MSHGSVVIVQKHRVRDETGFEMNNLQNVEKSGFGQSVCEEVCHWISYERADRFG